MADLRGGGKIKDNSGHKDFSGWPPHSYSLIWLIWTNKRLFISPVEWVASLGVWDVCGKAAPLFTFYIQLHASKKENVRQKKVHMSIC